MLKTIYKYPVEEDVHGGCVYLPLNAEILSAEIVRGDICIYALVDPTETSKKKHEVCVWGTGVIINEVEQEKIKNMTFLNTLVEPDEFFGELVWHVWIKE